jgi:hypothetical protein
VKKCPTGRPLRYDPASCHHRARESEKEAGEVDAVMTLTPKNGGLTVKQDMAGGQFSLTGAGKRKG